MALPNLILPIQGIGAAMSETWTAFQRTTRYADVPPLEPSLGLLGGALLDRTFSFTTALLTGVPLPSEIRRSVEDARGARDLFEAQGWLEDPESYHQEPPPLETWVGQESWSFAGTGRLHFRHVVTESGFAPHPIEPLRERWIDHPKNDALHLYVLEHDEPRPWIVCVHGFSMGTPLVNFAGFPVRWLHEELGLNVAMPVLPLHGPRSGSRFSGGELLQPDYLRMIHLFANAVWDLRRVVRGLRARGAERIGLYGISLGGYVSALTCGLEDGIDAVIASIPAVDFPTLARDNEPWILRRYDGDLHVDWQLVRELAWPVSPLAVTPRVPHEGRFIVAGIADRVAKPDQARALWRHWDESAIHWFQGGHILGSFDTSALPFLEKAIDSRLRR